MRPGGRLVALALAGVAALLTGCGPDSASLVEESVGGSRGSGPRRHVHRGHHRRHRRAHSQYHERRRIARSGQYDLRRPRQGRQGPELRRRHGGVVGVQPGLPRADVEAEAGHQVARRSPVHGRGRAVHLSGDDQSEDADGLQGGLPGRQERRGHRSLHVPRQVHASPRQGRAELEHVDAAQAPAREIRRGRQAQGFAGEQPAGRNGTVPISGVEERREGRARLEQRVLRGPARTWGASSTA